jgi:hypothetical protein
MGPLILLVDLIDPSIDLFWARATANSTTSPGDSASVGHLRQTPAGGDEKRAPLGAALKPLAVQLVERAPLGFLVCGTTALAGV